MIITIYEPAFHISRETKVKLANYHLCAGSTQFPDASNYFVYDESSMYDIPSIATCCST